MNKTGLTISARKCVASCLKTAKETNEPSVAIELPSGKIITGHRSELFGVCTVALLNTIKYLAKIDKKMFLLMSAVIEPMNELKTNFLHRSNTRLRAEVYQFNPVPTH